MNKLIDAIQEYKDYIKRSVLIMQEEFKTKELLRAWRTNKIPKNGKIKDFLTYDFHGVGCYIVINNVEVDFDFGPNHIYGGFEPWRLHSFIAQFPYKYSMYKDKKNLDIDFQGLIDSKIIYKPESDPNLYYFV